MLADIEGALDEKRKGNFLRKAIDQAPWEKWTSTAGENGIKGRHSRRLRVIQNGRALGKRVAVVATRQNVVRLRFFG